MGRGRDTRDIDVLQLFGIGEDASQLAREQIQLLAGDREPRELGDPGDVFRAEDRGHSQAWYHGLSAERASPRIENPRCAGGSPTGSNMTTRPTAVAGTWYPGTAGALRKDVEAYLSRADEWRGGAVRAIVAPHAGLMFSGPVGAHAYKAAATRAFEVVAVLVGPSPSSRSTASRCIRTALLPRRSAMLPSTIAALATSRRPPSSGRCRRRTPANTPWRCAAAVSADADAGDADRAAADGASNLRHDCRARRGAGARVCRSRRAAGGQHRPLSLFRCPIGAGARRPRAGVSVGIRS